MGLKSSHVGGYSGTARLISILAGAVWKFPAVGQPHSLRGLDSGIDGLTSALGPLGVRAAESASDGRHGCGAGA